MRTYKDETFILRVLFLSQVSIYKLYGCYMGIKLITMCKCGLNITGCCFVLKPILTCKLFIHGKFLFFTVLNLAAFVLNYFLCMLARLSYCLL